MDNNLLKKNMTLDDLANLYQTDKGSKYKGPSCHGYAEFYDAILSKIRDLPIRMLEVGVCMEYSGGGQSIKMWKDYFELGSIYTFDIVDMSNHEVMQDARVHFFRGDQGNRNDFEKMYEQFGNSQFDLIVEDGSHQTIHQMVSLGHLFKYVKSGGIYIMEDLSIPWRNVCCIRNDESLEIVAKFIHTKSFDIPYLLPEEKEYLEKNIQSVEIITDIQNAYVSAIFFKK